jgi:hypothetical protein
METSKAKNPEKVFNKILKKRDKVYKGLSGKKSKRICPVCLGGKMLLRYSRNVKAPVLSQMVIMVCSRCKGKGSI